MRPRRSPSGSGDVIWLTDVGSNHHEEMASLIVVILCCGTINTPIVCIYIHRMNCSGVQCSICFTPQVLRLRHVSSSDGGLYACTAENQVGYVRANTSLTVHCESLDVDRNYQQLVNNSTGGDFVVFILKHCTSLT